MVPRLFHAIMDDDVNKVIAALAEDPEAAQMPFMDNRWEPPLCVAARLGCSQLIFATLIEHGACVHQEDERGRTPLEVLIAREIESDVVWPPWMPDSVFSHEEFPTFVDHVEISHVVLKAQKVKQRTLALAIAGFLLAAGADATRIVEKFRTDSTTTQRTLTPGERLRELLLIEQ